MTAVCPKNKKHKRFVTTAHEMHDWVVDEHGAFIKDDGCIDTTVYPDPGNIWTCIECGAEAKVSYG